MSARYDCTDTAQRAAGIAEATAVLRKGELAVLPTDTVYGVAADAFMPQAVTAPAAAKNPGQQNPPPRVGRQRRAAAAPVRGVTPPASDVIDEFGPGGPPRVFHPAGGRVWDLGETKGTVAVGMPMRPVALDLLGEPGPLGVSSATLPGSPPATTAAEAEAQ